MEKGQKIWDWLLIVIWKRLLKIWREWNRKSWRNIISSHKWHPQICLQKNWVCKNVGSLKHDKFFFKRWVYYVEHNVSHVSWVKLKDFIIEWSQWGLLNDMRWRFFSNANQLLFVAVSHAIRVKFFFEKFDALMSCNIRAFTSFIADSDFGIENEAQTFIKLYFSNENGVYGHACNASSSFFKKKISMCVHGMNNANVTSSYTCIFELNLKLKN